MGMVILLAKAREELRPNMGYLLDKEPHSVPYYRHYQGLSCTISHRPLSEREVPMPRSDEVTQRTGS
jgi:hypothetical protein